MSSLILTLVIFSPLLGAVAIALVPREAEHTVRRWALGFSILALVLTLVACVMFSNAAASDPAGSGAYHLRVDVP